MSDDLKSALDKMVRLKSGIGLGAFDGPSTRDYEAVALDLLEQLWKSERNCAARIKTAERFCQNSQVENAELKQVLKDMRDPLMMGFHIADGTTRFQIKLAVKYLDRTLSRFAQLGNSQEGEG